MIYQLYYKEEHKEDLFNNSAYTGFGLEPELNDKLLDNCPELEDPKTRLQLVEYAAFLWHWRNDDGEPWIGTTSHRQLKKNIPFVFESYDQVDSMIRDHGIVGWGNYKFMGQSGKPITLAQQSEICHPGLNEHLVQGMKQFGHNVPLDWVQSSDGFFANYWVMRKDLFNDFMEFSWPIVKWSYESVEDSSLYKNQNKYGTVTPDKATGYLQERLFVIWYLKNNIRPFNASGQMYPLVHRGL